MASNEKIIKMTEMAVGHNDLVIKTGSLGSCVAIVLYDKEHKVGGMAHAMLPSKQEHNTGGAYDKDESIAKFVDSAIDNMIEEIQKEGGEKSNLRAKLVGGSKMFKILSGDDHGVGFRNVEAAENHLKKLNIPIDGEDTGGTIGRSAEFDLATGLVDVNTKM
jgi:chemotaxis protein CheD